MSLFRMEKHEISGCESLGIFVDDSQPFLLLGWNDRFPTCSATCL